MLIQVCFLLHGHICFVTNGRNSNFFRLTHSTKLQRVNTHTPLTSKFRGSTPCTGQTWRGRKSVLVRQDAQTERHWELWGSCGFLHRSHIFFISEADLHTEAQGAKECEFWVHWDDRGGGKLCCSWLNIQPLRSLPLHNTYFKKWGRG